jgi:hypothetical protein
VPFEGSFDGRDYFVGDHDVKTAGCAGKASNFKSYAAHVLEPAGAATDVRVIFGVAGSAVEIDAVFH